MKTEALILMRMDPPVIVGTPGFKWAITMFFIRRILSAPTTPWPPER